MTFTLVLTEQEAKIVRATLKTKPTLLPMIRRALDKAWKQLDTQIYPQNRLNPESEEYVGHNEAIELGASCICHKYSHPDIHCPYHGR